MIYAECTIMKARSKLLYAECSFTKAQSQLLYAECSFTTPTIKTAICRMFINDTQQSQSAKLIHIEEMYDMVEENKKGFAYSESLVLHIYICICSYICNYIYNCICSHIHEAVYVSLTLNGSNCHTCNDVLSHEYVYYDNW